MSGSERSSGTYTFRRPRKYPEPTSRVAWAIVVAIVLLLLGCGLGLRRAYADDLDQLAAAVWAMPTPVPAPELTRYVPAARGGRLEREEVVALAAETFGPALAERVAGVVRCESTNHPGADTNPPYVGLMQVDPYIHAGKVGRVVGYPVTPREAAWLLRDPRINLEVSVLIWQESGWSAWPWCGR